MAEIHDRALMRFSVVEAVRHTKIPRDELVVVGGAAMQLFGIKKSDDVDVVVRPERMVELLGEKLNSPHHGGRAEFDSDNRQLIVEETGQRNWHDDAYGVRRGIMTFMLAPNDDLYRATFDELLGEAVKVDGVLASPLDRILAWKRGVSRPKDLEDIALIEQHLNLS